MLDLLKRASDIAGRDIEVVETTDGMYIVLFMNFNASPPPKGHTELAALELFIEHSKKRGTHGDHTGSVGESSTENTGL